MGKPSVMAKTALVYTFGVPNAGVSLVTDGCDGRILNLNGNAERVW